jgi:hypothetical protein
MLCHSDVMTALDSVIAIQCAFIALHPPPSPRHTHTFDPAGAMGVRPTALPRVGVHAA